MGITNYDYAIIGAGAAGLNLALAMTKDPFFKSKSIVLLDPAKKDVNDKTWCFWHEETTFLEPIISKSWKKAVFATRRGEEYVLELSPFSYHMIRAIDFYNYAKKELGSHSNVYWLEEKVKDLSTYEDEVKIYTPTKEIKIKEHIFDSRVTEDFQKDTSSIKLLQHFKGWVIETEKESFDDSSFVMMDFSLIWKDTTSFSYVLPYSTKKALVEFTFFSPDLVDDSDYDIMIKKYLHDHLNISKYTLYETEKGVIPMSDYPFQKGNSSKITKIGTAGSWVKPSSGYSFRNAIHLSQQIVDNIVQGKAPAEGLISSKHRFYDALFLDVLYSKNYLGPDLLATMYQKNKVQQIFKFLNEETSFLEDLKIMSTFPMAPFNKALLKKIFLRGLW
ncbi:MAG: lycopene cyclase family protein [Bacteroidota bacterium]